MMKTYIQFIIISIIISFVSSNDDATCNKQSNTDCNSCLKISGCAFCTDNKICFAYTPPGIHAPCGSIDKMKYVTCVGSIKTWLIVLGSVGGVVLIAIIAIIVCICRKRKQRLRHKEIALQKDLNQKMEDRRTAAEIRSAGRNQAADQIRMKYGLLKAKDDGTEYRRMS